jgi:DNA-binding transcriptional MerR regulator
MRISELARHSGVPVATIKFYLREGLLPKGEATSATRAEYTGAHLRRLRLVRALVEVGDLPLSRVRAVLRVVDDPATDLHRALGTLHYAVADDPPAPEDDPGWDAARRRTDDLLAGLGWRVTDHAPDRRRLTRAVAAMAELGRPVDDGALRAYAAAAHTAAEHDVARIGPGDTREEVLEYAVLVSALMEQAMTALHRLAREDVSAARFAASGERGERERGG